MYESFDPVSRSFSLVCFFLPLVGDTFTIRRKPLLDDSLSLASKVESSMNDVDDIDVALS